MNTWYRVGKQSYRIEAVEVAKVTAITITNIDGYREDKETRGHLYFKSPQDAFVYLHNLIQREMNYLQQKLDEAITFNERHAVLY